jgi:hypothetical protein
VDTSGGGKIIEMVNPEIMEADESRRTGRLPERTERMGNREKADAF